MKKNIHIIILSLTLLLSGRAYSMESVNTVDSTTSDDVWDDDKVGLYAFEEDDDIEVDDDFETDSVDSLAGLSEDEQLAAIDSKVREAIDSGETAGFVELLESSDLGKDVILEKYFDSIADDNNYEEIVKFIDSLSDQQLLD